MVWIERALCSDVNRPERKRVTAKELNRKYRFNPKVIPEELNSDIFNLSDKEKRKNSKKRITSPIARRRVIAKGICRLCPVRQECLDFAIRTEDLSTVIGGTTPDERRHMVYAFRRQNKLG